LRGRKGSSYEGGVREPFIARFPGRIPAGARGRTRLGRVSNAIATTMDLLPTFARLANAQLPNVPLDGVDLWPILSEQSETVDREIFLYFDNWNLQCARMGPWKLHMSRYNNYAFAPEAKAGFFNLPLVPQELYNVEADPEEGYNVADRNPQVVAEIQARVQKMLPSFPAQVTQSWKDTMSRRVVGSEADSLPVLATP